METQIFEDIVHLLQSVDWLYNYPMTQVFTRDIFDHMPEEWQGVLKNLPLDALNDLPRCHTMENWPVSLKKFLKECDRLSYISEDSGSQTFHGNNTSCNSSKMDGVQIPQELTLGLTAKKKHEITALLCVVKKALDLTGSRHILDVGSGKGYIDSCIHRILCAQVCGIEGNKKLMRSAEKHHWKLYGHCRGINFLNWHLSDDVETVCRVGQLVSYLSELDPNCSCLTKSQAKALRVKGANKCKPDTIEGSESDVGEDTHANSEGMESPHCQGESDIPPTCRNTDPRNPCTLLGLHACADLSPIIIKVFKDCNQASALVLLSCCYHKMSVHPKAQERPVNSEQEVTPKSSDGQEWKAECTYQTSQVFKAANSSINVNQESPSENRGDMEEDIECSIDRQPHHTQSEGGFNIVSEATNSSINVNQESPSENRGDLEEDIECSIDRQPHHAQSEGGFNIVSEENDFVNFPMSHCLQEVFRLNNFYMSVFGLRLGAQESGMKWRKETLEDHEYHMRNVAYRGVLEAACVTEGFTLQKLRRRCARKSSFRDFSEYKKDIFENYEFHRIYSYGETSNTTSSYPSGDHTLSSDKVKTETANTHISVALDSFFEKYQHYFPLIEPLTGLQLALQPVIEMMVQMDRLIYLKECGFSKVWLEKVFDPEVSPRNIALMAVR